MTFVLAFTLYICLSFQSDWLILIISLQSCFDRSFKTLMLSSTVYPMGIFPDWNSSFPEKFSDLWVHDLTVFSWMEIFQVDIFSQVRKIVFLILVQALF